MSGLPTVTARRLGPQYWVGATTPDAQRLSVIRNGGLGKPLGGLWTSTALRKRVGGRTQWTSAWVDWSRARLDTYDVDALPHWLLVPESARRVLVLDSLETLATVAARYADRAPSTDLLQLDWCRLARDYCGVTLPQTAIAAVVHGGVPGLHLRTWEVESTVWFEWVFTDRVRALQPDEIYGARPSLPPPTRFYYHIAEVRDR